MAIITLITDFGLEDEHVGLLKGVILGIDPAALVVDVTHAIKPQEVDQAAFALEASFRFGNLISNIPAGLLEEVGGEGEGVHIIVGEACLSALSKTYAHGAPGAPLALIGSRGYLEIAVNRGSAQAALGLGTGDPVRVRR